jgi:hypothetical protein
MQQLLIRSSGSQTPVAECDLSWLQSQFQNSPYSPLRGIVCELSNGRLTIRGCVPSFYLKQLAHTLALKAVAPERLESRIEVRIGY